MTWRHLPPVVDAREAAALGARLRSPVAVTGCTGFIGSHVLEAISSAGVPCRVLARDPRRVPVSGANVEVVVGGLDDRSALERLVSGCPIVLHLAGAVRAGRAEVFDRVNRVGTENLLTAAAHTSPGCRMVLVSSQAAAGPSPSPAGRRPEDVPAPVSAYGRSKLAAEELVRRWGAGDWTIVRPPAVYGPRDVDVFQFFRLASRGIVPLPAGERWVTMAHVADVLRGVLSTAAGGVDGRVLHLGHPEAMTMDDLVTRLARAGGVRVRTLRVPVWVLRGAGRVGDLLQLLGWSSVAMTSDKARELSARHWSFETASSLDALGIGGAVPFSEGAAETWAWYRANQWLPRGTIAPV